MATRRINELYAMEKTVVAAGAATVGYLLERTAGAATVNNCTTATIGMYVAAETGAAGASVKVYGPGCGCIPVEVGTGGATAGSYAAWAAANDGFTNAPALADGNTVTAVYGVFEDSGVAGDIVGLWFQPRTFVESA
jgi:hypothetical protein